MAVKIKDKPKENNLQVSDQKKVPIQTDPLTVNSDVDVRDKSDISTYF